MEEENIYKKIQDAISSLPDNFSILEEQIDIELQVEYFKFKREEKAILTDDLIDKYIIDLNNPDVLVQDKKRVLVLLASVDKVEAYRSIEKYSKNPDPELREWSILAFQEICYYHASFV